jgi:hypothetical protein
MNTRPLRIFLAAGTEALWFLAAAGPRAAPERSTFLVS